LSHYPVEVKIQQHSNSSKHHQHTIKTPSQFLLACARITCCYNVTSPLPYRTRNPVTNPCLPLWRPQNQPPLTPRPSSPSAQPNCGLCRPPGPPRSIASSPVREENCKSSAMIPSFSRNPTAEISARDKRLIPTPTQSMTSFPPGMDRAPMRALSVEGASRSGELFTSTAIAGAYCDHCTVYSVEAYRCKQKVGTVHLYWGPVCHIPPSPSSLIPSLHHKFPWTVLSNRSKTRRHEVQPALSK
jgi:hypothetical protein